MVLACAGRRPGIVVRSEEVLVGLIKGLLKGVVVQKLLSRFLGGRRRP
jgi:hypothetical protein